LAEGGDALWIAAKGFDAGSASTLPTIIVAKLGYVLVPQPFNGNTLVHEPEILLRNRDARESQNA
jgi:hypothetical protein